MFKPLQLLPVALAFITPLGLADESIVLQAAQIKSLGISTQAVSRLETGRSSTLAAQVLVPSAQMRVVAAPVAGMIEMLATAPGSKVKRGQVLAHLSSPQALELQRDALQANTQAQLQQQNKTRDELLFAEGLIAESRLQATRAAAKQAETQAGERRQSLSLAGIAAGKLGGPLVLTAPIDGVVLEQGTQLGQRVEAATLIYRIAQLSPLWLEIQAPMDVASDLREGMQVKVLQREISGKLIAIGRAVDAASQTILIRAQVNQGAELLNPGQVVEVDIADHNATAKTQQRVSLPATALIRHQGKTLVFSRTASNEKESSFTPRSVQLVKQGGDSVWVEGLKRDETIVINGSSALKSMLNAHAAGTGGQ